MLPDVDPDNRKDVEKWVLVRSSRQLKAVGGGIESLNIYINKPYRYGHGENDSQASPSQIPEFQASPH